MNSTSIPRWMTIVVLVAANALALGRPGALPAQDILLQGDRHGIKPPPSVRQMVVQDPRAFEFRRAWRQKVERIRQNRVALEAQVGPQLSTMQLQSANAAVTGTLQLPLLAGLYSDATAPYDTSAYRNQIFGDDASRYSVRTYYRELSRSAFEVDGRVIGWMQLPQPASYYEPSSTTDPAFGRTGEFLRDVLVRADSVVDFGQFDNDGPDGVPNSGDDDGYVDVAAFVYPAVAMSCGGPGIWPHRWVYSGWWGSPFDTDDASANGGTIKVDDYTIQSGIACDGSSMMTIGTLSHEIGHALALPDLYDTDSSDGESEGIGHWGLMASGNWNSQDSPAHMSAWSKDFLGWVNVDTLSQSVSAFVLDPVYSQGQVLRFDIPGTREYFLLEHRNATGSDRDIHGSGLLVYHVDQQVIDDYRSRNEVNAHSRLGVAVEQADGQWDLEGGLNRGDAGDPFPGSAGTTSFGDATAPNSRTNDGAWTGFELTNIQLLDGVLSLDIQLPQAGSVYLTATPPEPVVVPVGGVDTLALGVETTTGDAVGVGVDWSASWLTVSPDTGQTPLGLTLRLDATGLAAGTYSDTLWLRSASAENSPLAVPVTLEVGSSVLALGDSIVDEISTLGERDTVYIALEAGDTVDLAVFGTGTNPLVDPVLEVRSSAGSWLTYSDDFRGWDPLIPAWVVPSTDTYMLIVRGFSDSRTGEYVLKARQSGPVVATEPWSWMQVAAPEGGSAGQDTLWVYNAGSGTASFSVSASESWLSVSPATGTLEPAAVADGDESTRGLAAGGMVEADDLAALARSVQAGPEGKPDLRVYRSAERAPAGAVPVVVTADPTGFAQGVQHGSVTVSLPDDPWGGEATVSIYFHIYDPVVDVFASTPAWALERMPDGRLFLGTEVDGRVLEVDPETGQMTERWRFADSGAYVTGLAAWNDSTLVAAVGGSSGNRIAALHADGSVETLFTMDEIPRGVAVTPGGVIYALDWGGLWRYENGNATQVSMPSSTTFGYTGMGYDPASGRVLVANYVNNAIYAYDTESSTWSTLATLDASFTNDIEVGASGRVYFEYSSRSSGGYIGWVEPDGTVRTGPYLPDGVLTGMALYAGELFVNGPYRSELYRLPVQDAPVGGEVPVAAWVEPTGSAAVGDTLEVPVFIDVSSAGEAVGGYAASLGFDESVLRFVGLDAADFAGTFTTDVAGADTGFVSFGGTNTDPTANVDTTRVALARFEVVDWSAATALDLEVSQLTSTGGTDLTGTLYVGDATVAVGAGPLAFAAVAEPRTVTRSGTTTLRVRMDLSRTVARPGAVDVKVHLDPAVAVVDSVGAGSYGGTLQASTSIQADSGFVRIAVLNANPPDSDTLDAAILYVRAAESAAGGDSTAVELELVELTDADSFTNLLPYVEETAGTTLTVSTGVWGDAAPDVDTDGDGTPDEFDNTITARDALVCLSHVVGKTLPDEMEPGKCDVAPDVDSDGDGTPDAFDGTVSARDALVILSHVVGKALPEEMRVGEPR